MRAGEPSPGAAGPADARPGPAHASRPAAAAPPAPPPRPPARAEAPPARAQRTTAHPAAEPPAPRPPARVSAPPLPARPLLENELFDEDTMGEAPIPPEMHQLADDGAYARDGREALQAGRYGEARELLARALDTDPRDRYLRAIYHLAAGYEAKEAGLGEEARKHFETVLLFDKQCREAIQELRAPGGGDPQGERDGLQGKLGRLLKKKVW
jgi:tetratricopeptide (TPR) repeat protein